MKKKNPTIACLLVLTLLIPTSCKKEDPVIVSVNGFVQKGPFNNGTTINAYELTENIVPTGRVYNSQIEDNSGLFHFTAVKFESSMIKFEANGYYYNEILGENSDGPLTLYALCDVSDKNSVNVNILTHLEKARVEYLVVQGLDFAAAKLQAQQEIFHIFNIDNSLFQSSENLDIMKEGDENAALLAISAILQGYRNTAGLSQLLAAMVSDFSSDGIINDTVIQSELISDIIIANIPDIRNNLSSYYNELGLSSSVVPEFESYIGQFIDSTGFPFVDPVEFPDNGSYGLNILSENNTDFVVQSMAHPQQHYSIAAVLPWGVSLKVEAPGLSYASGYTINALPGWNNSGELVVTSMSPCTNFDIMVSFTEPGVKFIKIYYNDSEIPWYTREITVVD